MIWLLLTGSRLLLRTLKLLVRGRFEKYPKKKDFDKRLIHLFSLKRKKRKREEKVRNESLTFSSFTIKLL